MAKLPPFRRDRPVGRADANGNVTLFPEFIRAFFEPLTRAADEGAQINGGVGYVWTIATRRALAAWATTSQRQAKSMAATAAQRQSGAHTATAATRQQHTHTATTAPRAASCRAGSIARRT